MNIGELFVNLGIKGAEKTIGTLGAVKKGMGEIGSTSLEAKAAIVGAMYGLEQMMAISGRAGTNLVNFAALTGISAQNLQQWQYAARQAGVSSEELTGSLKSVQTAMTSMLMGESNPKGIAMLSQAVGGLDPARYKDTLYMMTKLQEGMQNMSPEMAQFVGKSFGLTEGVMAGMRRGVFTPENFAKAPTYSDNEAASLAKSQVAWANLGNTIEMAFGHFNAKHGQALVGDISKTVAEVAKLAEAFTKLAEKVKLFSLIDDVFKGWGIIFDTIGTGVDKLMSLMGSTGENGGKDSALDKSGNLKKDPMNMLSDWVVKHVMSANKMDNFHALQSNIQKVKDSHINSGVTVHQNIVHHGDAKDTQGVGDVHKTSVNNAFRQRPAQRRGTG